LAYLATLPPRDSEESLQERIDVYLEAYGFPIPGSEEYAAWLEEFRRRNRAYYEGSVYRSWADG